MRRLVGAVALGHAPTVGSSFQISDMPGSAFLATGQYLRLPDQTELLDNDEFLVAGTTLRITYDRSAGGGVTLTAVPEPDSLVLLGCGAVAAPAGGGSACLAAAWGRRRGESHASAVTWQRAGCRAAP